MLAPVHNLPPAGCGYAGLMFLTRLPCPGWCDHHPAFLMRSMQWFPLLGLLIGCWGAVFFNAAVLLWSPILAAGVSTLATVWLTGEPHCLTACLSD
jgi:adenosylcobinamide-GDP ribazoletransferase